MVRAVVVIMLINVTKYIIFFVSLTFSLNALSDSVYLGGCHISLGEQQFYNTGGTKNFKNFYDFKNSIAINFGEYDIELVSSESLKSIDEFIVGGLSVKHYSWIDSDFPNFFIVDDNENYLKISTDDKNYVINFLNGCEWK